METDVALLLGIIVVLILLLLTLLWFLGYCGLFAAIDIKAEKPPFEELQIAYKFCRGSHKNSGALFTEVHSLAPSLKCIGVYYDDPLEVESQQLRYLVGVVVNDKECPATGEMKQQLQAGGFKTARFPAVDHALTTVFPFRGSVSVMIAVARVYPKLREYIKEKSLCARPLVELYEKDRVVFVCPLAKQDEFLVPEATEEPSSEEEPSSGSSTEDDQSPQDGIQDGIKHGTQHDTQHGTQDGTQDGTNGAQDGIQDCPQPPSRSPPESDRASRSSTTSSFEELHAD